MTRDELKVGDIPVYRTGNSIVSKLIRLITTSDYTHVSAVYSKSLLDDVNYTLVEAQARGVVYSWSHRSFLSNEDLIHAYRLRRKPKGWSDKQFQKVCQQYIGKKYGFIDLIAILTHRLSGKKLFKDTANRLICSETIIRIYKDMGVDLCPGVDPSYASPEDVANSKKLKRIYL